MTLLGVFSGAGLPWGRTRSSALIVSVDGAVASPAERCECRPFSGRT